MLACISLRGLKERCLTGKCQRGLTGLIWIMAFSGHTNRKLVPLSVMTGGTCNQVKLLEQSSGRCFFSIMMLLVSGTTMLLIGIAA